MVDRQGRGPIAVADMKARLAAGWGVSQLWDRMVDAEVHGQGYSYDMAEKLPADAPVRRQELVDVES